MASEGINTKASGSPENIIELISGLGLAELEKVGNAVHLFIARKKAPYIPKEEEKLLDVIFQELPSGLRQRYDELYYKSRTPGMPEDEQTELDALIEKFMARDVERLEAMSKLARIRNISLVELKKQLEINLPIHV